MNPDQHSDEYLNDPGFQSVLVSCLEKLERGEPLDRDHLLKAHPDYADALDAFITDQAMLKRVANQVRDSLSGRPAGRIPSTWHSRTRKLHIGTSLIYDATCVV